MWLTPRSPRDGSMQQCPTGSRPTGSGSRRTKRTRAGCGESLVHATTGTRSVNATVPRPVHCSLDGQEGHALWGEDRPPQDTVLVPAHVGQRHSERHSTGSHVLVRDKGVHVDHERADVDRQQFGPLMTSRDVDRVVSSVGHCCIERSRTLRAADPIHIRCTSQPPEQAKRRHERVASPCGRLRNQLAMAQRNSAVSNDADDAWLPPTVFPSRFSLALAPLS